MRVLAGGLVAAALVKPSAEVVEYPTCPSHVHAFTLDLVRDCEVQHFVDHELDLVFEVIDGEVVNPMILGGTLASEETRLWAFTEVVNRDYRDHSGWFEVHVPSFTGPLSEVGRRESPACEHFDEAPD